MYTSLLCMVHYTTLYYLLKDDVLYSKLNSNIHTVQSTKLYHTLQNTVLYITPPTIVKYTKIHYITLHYKHPSETTFCNVNFTLLYCIEHCSKLCMPQAAGGCHKYRSWSGLWSAELSIVWGPFEGTTLCSQ